MAWTRIILTKDSLKEADDGTASAQRTYYCESDATVQLDEALIASIEGGLAVPQLADPFSDTRPSCMVNSRDVSRLSPRQLEVEVAYQETAGGSWITNEDLLAKPIRVSRGHEAVMEPYEEDYDDPPNIVRNAAGDRFDHMPERQVGITVFTCKKYVNADTREVIETALNTNNDGVVTIDGKACDVDTLWLFSAAYEPVNGAEGVWEASYVIKHKPGKWKDVVMNRGFYELSGGEHLRLLDIDKNGKERPITSPWPLDESGAARSAATDDPSELVFWPYTQSSWAAVPVT